MSSFPEPSTQGAVSVPGAETGVPGRSGAEILYFPSRMLLLPATPQAVGVAGDLSRQTSLRKLFWVREQSVKGRGSIRNFRSLKKVSPPV